MLENTPAAPSHPDDMSLARAFLTAPAPVKALTGGLYLTAAMYAGQALTAGNQFGNVSPDVAAAATTTVVFTTALALASLLLGAGIARGAHIAWRLALALNLSALSYHLVFLAAGATTTSVSAVAITTSVLVLLLTPVVRRHCAAK